MPAKHSATCVIWSHRYFVHKVLFCVYNGISAKGHHSPSFSSSSSSSSSSLLLLLLLLKKFVAHPTDRKKDINKTCCASYSYVKMSCEIKELHTKREREKTFFNFINYSIELKELEDEVGASLPRRRLRDRDNPLDMRDSDFVINHGMSKFAFCHLLELTKDQLQPLKETPITLPPNIKLSALLRFLRSGSFQRCVGSDQGLRISQPAACQAINHGAEIFATMQQQYIQFPTLEERTEIAKQFSSETGFPPVICGLIDGCHLEIERPRIESPAPEKFFNRKGFYSFNMMCIVDFQGKFRYFTCRHPGSCHDSKIFGESTIRGKLVQEFDARQPLALIGDEGYGCEDVLLPPVRRQQLRGSQGDVKAKMEEYNRVHKKTRIKVEHSFGILKKRWPALLYQMRCKKLKNVQALVATAIILHNLLIDLKEPAAMFEVGLHDADFQRELARLDMNADLPPNTREKFRLRNFLIEKFF